MNRTTPLRTMLMSADIKTSGPGFHCLVFRVDCGQSSMSQVTVLISQDAHRKLASQMARARLRPVDSMTLLKTWARWEIRERMEEFGIPPASVTITASDLDDFGAYATALGRAINAG